MRSQAGARSRVWAGEASGGVQIVLYAEALTALLAHSSEVSGTLELEGSLR